MVCARKLTVCHIHVLTSGGIHKKVTFCQMADKIMFDIDNEVFLKNNFLKQKYFGPWFQFWLWRWIAEWGIWDIDSKQISAYHQQTKDYWQYLIHRPPLSPTILSIYITWPEQAYVRGEFVTGWLKHDVEKDKSAYFKAVFDKRTPVINNLVHLTVLLSGKV